MKHYFTLEGQNRIVWNIEDGDAHKDDLEMSGKGIDVTVVYSVDENRRLAPIKCKVVVPTLHTRPRNTHSALHCDFMDIPEEDLSVPDPIINGMIPEEKGVRVTIEEGVLSILSEAEGITIERCFFPAAEKRAVCVKTVVTNVSGAAIRFGISKPAHFVFRYVGGSDGMYLCESDHTAPQEAVIESGKSLGYYVCYSARRANEKPVRVHGETELALRKARCREFISSASLDTGNEILDTFYAFSKIRASESVFDLRCGPLHSPGGGPYYAASWANDQVEYSGPWFAQAGDEYCIEAAKTAYRQYTAFMSDSYTKIPCSVICEGTDCWDGAGDRGDAAMYLYGCSLFLLTLCDRDADHEFWQYIKWCAEYCRRKTNEDGVVESDNDELEGRFPTDNKANLSTSVLTYGGYRLAAVLARKFGEAEYASELEKRADELDGAIERYFGATLHEFETYRYSRGFDSLRAWICLPLCMGIDRRVNGTVEALTSPYLWNENGIYTVEDGPDSHGSHTVWDRSTLYAFRGLFFTGEGDRVWENFCEYCYNRLLGERVPYPFEAYPEGGKRHLSGESSLFCRIVTEGLLGIVPCDGGFSFTPRLPGDLDHLDLSDCYFYGHRVDFRCRRDGCFVLVDGVKAAECRINETATVTV